jgi:hypothetical protein
VDALRRACCVAALTLRPHRSQSESREHKGELDKLRLVTWATVCKAARTISAAFYNVLKR